MRTRASVTVSYAVIESRPHTDLTLYTGLTPHAYRLDSLTLHAYRPDTTYKHCCNNRLDSLDSAVLILTHYFCRQTRGEQYVHIKTIQYAGKFSLQKDTKFNDLNLWPPCNCSGSGMRHPTLLNLYGEFDWTYCSGCKISREDCLRSRRDTSWADGWGGRGRADSCASLLTGECFRLLHERQAQKVPSSTAINQMTK